MRLGVIPARGGSKRIPRKNIKAFAGKPMIAWSIEAAIGSQCFDQLIVSTDDDEIAEIARGYGADVPFMRPTELAGDQVDTISVVQHAIQWFQCRDITVNEVCCLYATAPFMKTSDIAKGLKVLQERSCDYAFSVTSYSSPIQRALRLLGDGRVQMFQPDHFRTRSQDLEEAWHDAGQFYWGRMEAWNAGLEIFSGNSSAIVLPRYRVQDIDTPEDWLHAEWMFRALAAVRVKE